MLAEPVAGKIAVCVHARGPSLAAHSSSIRHHSQECKRGFFDEKIFSDPTKKR
jgi:hypothetical protein